VEDELCLTYCPTLFIVGELAMDTSLETMQHIRRNMVVDSGMVVVGSANHNLYVSSTRLTLERLSQKCVERSIIESVVDFVRQVTTDLGSPSDCRGALKPIQLPSLYEVDMAALRANRGATGGQKSKKKDAATAGGSTVGAGEKSGGNIKQALVQAFEKPMGGDR